MYLPPHGSCRRVSNEEFYELIADNPIWFGAYGNNVPRLKRFLSEIQDGMVPLTLWLHQEVGHNQEGRQEIKDLFDDKGYFDGPKPVRLLNRILKIANTTGSDIILDFFSGSATTAHAVLDLNKQDSGNRKFILVQLPEPCASDSEAFKTGYRTIADIGKERIRRVIKKIQEELTIKNTKDTKKEDKQELSIFGTCDEPVRDFRVVRGSESLDLGFKVLKLDKSNFKQWQQLPPTTPPDKIAEQLSLHIDHIDHTRSLAL